MNDNTANFQPNGVETLKTLVTVVKALTNDSSFKFASAVLEENAKLRKQIESQQADLARLTNRAKDLETVKATAYQEMFDMNEKERLKYADACKEIDSLKAKIRENEQTIADQKKRIDDVNREIQEVKQVYDKEKQKVVSANHDIDELQNTLKSKESQIDELKTAGSKLKQAHTSLKSKYKELDSEKSQVEEKMRQNSSRLIELEGYAVELNEAPEVDL